MILCNEFPKHVRGTRNVMNALTFILINCFNLNKLFMQALPLLFYKLFLLNSMFNYLKKLAKKMRFSSLCDIQESHALRKSEQTICKLRQQIIDSTKKLLSIKFNESTLSYRIYESTLLMPFHISHNFVKIIL